jgi:hypothetical protein
MRTGIVVEVTTAERDRLEAIVADRNSPQKHVWRAGIVLAKLVNLAPGMAVTVEIKTRSRSVSYLLSPLLRYKQESLRER